ncbi:MAG: glycosyltransferase [Archangium sp.]|nr:glycosyltransferase [Archangium sp.]
MSITLVISPESYPWDLAKEQTFLAPEIEVLSKEPISLVMAPQRIGGQRLAVPTGVEVDESLAREVAGLRRAELVIRAARTSLVAEEFVRRGRALSSLRALKRLVDYAGRAQHAADWARRFVRARRLEGSRVIFASYWWGPVTTGVGLAAATLPELRVASRAHGFDLYEDRSEPAYLPCRHRALAVLHGLFPDSETGTRWLKRTYTKLPRVETARLGVANPGVQNRPSADGTLRVVTCSLQVPVKRLELLVDAVAHAGGSGARIEWTHHGTGPLQSSLEARARRLFPSNVRVTFAGYSTQKELFEWYRTHPADVFVNVSQSEGTPVSIMEAIACGIPVLATAVGGNPEICTARNGLLVGENPTAEEVGAALLRFAPGASTGWREGSLAIWREKYDAASNYRGWLETLRSL